MKSGPWPNEWRFERVLLEMIPGKSFSIAFRPNMGGSSERCFLISIIEVFLSAFDGSHVHI
jgi:hypothetical protein